MDGTLDFIDEDNDDSGIGDVYDDPAPTRTLIIEGGSCSTITRRGPSSPVAPLSLAVALLGGVLARRRRKAALLGATVALAAAAPSVASAQEDLAFQVEHFEPLPSQGTNINNVALSDTLEQWRPSFGVFAHYVDDPLQVTTLEDDDVIVTRLIDNQLKVEAMVGVGLLNRLDIGVAFPFTVYQTGADLGQIGRPGETVDSFAMSDPRIVPKLKLIDHQKRNGFGLALLVPVFLPLGEESNFNSDGNLRVEPRLAFDWRNKKGLTFAANVGYQIRDTNIANNVVIDDVVRVGAAALIPAGPEWLRLTANVFGNIALDDNVDGDGNSLDINKSSPFEILGGAQIDLPANIVASVGGGTGLTSGVGSPDFRIYTSFGYTPVNNDSDNDGVPNADDQCPTQPEDQDGFMDTDGCPDLDNDEDKVPDTKDQCPMEPEDFDGFEEQDGCPDLDNDQDGIPDTEDKCSLEPEDVDEFEDTDGCPEPDNDKDGVLDVEDACINTPGIASEKGCPVGDSDKDGILDTEDLCPDNPEDFDAFEDSDGCPETDNDGDKVFDPEDACPLQPGVTNKNPKKNGCPKGSKVRVTQKSIEIEGTIFFDTNRAKIKRKSYPLLNEIAEVLIEYKQITKIRVEGHTDDMGKDDYNLDLSKRRAASVKRYLIKKGVKVEVVDSEGYGETIPLCKDIKPEQLGKRSKNKKIKACRSTNRRVEFRILEVDGKPVDQKSIVIEEKKEVITE